MVISSWKCHKWWYQRAPLTHPLCSQAWGEFVDKFPTIYLFDWIIWPPSQAVNFLLVPARFRYTTRDLINDEETKVKRERILRVAFMRWRGTRQERVKSLNTRQMENECRDQLNLKISKSYPGGWPFLRKLWWWLFSCSPFNYDDNKTLSSITPQCTPTNWSR